jgi:hypothetical protein
MCRCVVDACVAEFASEGLKDQGAACGGAGVGALVMRLACPPADPARCARPGGRARAGRPGGPGGRWISHCLRPDGFGDASANPSGEGQPLKRPRRALDAKAASRRERWPAASLDIVARDEVSSEDEGMAWGVGVCQPLG